MNNKTAWIREYFIITLGTLIAAAAIFFFMLPSHVAVGSLSAFVMVLTNFIPVSVSVLTLIFNIALLIFGFVMIGKEFGGKTVYTATLLPIFLGVFERLFPDNQSLTGDPFLDMLGYVFVVSIGMAILFHNNASSGGLDIVAKFLNKFFHIELGTAVTAAGLVTALSAAFVYDAKIVFLSVLGTFLNGVILDYFIMGINPKKRICIISKKEEDVIRFLLDDLHCGATLYHAFGAYDRQERTEIITIVNRAEYAKLLDQLYKIDPKAFVTVYSVSEVMNHYTARIAK
ncbi:MAG: YitT family protein [Eubacteriales bacterium]|nr:YitT family protein [Eubacteriales bacterium]